MCLSSRVSGVKCFPVAQLCLPHLTGAFNNPIGYKAWSLDVVCFQVWLRSIAQLRWLLDVASANEPARSEERAGVADPVSANPRQLGGVDDVRVVTVRVTLVETRVQSAGQSCSDG